MNTWWIMTAVGLFVGTYTVRLLPFRISGIAELPPPIRRFLHAVPAAALGALIAPDAFTHVHPILAALVVALSLILAGRGVRLIIVVAVAIVVTWLGVVFGPATLSLIP